MYSLFKYTYTKHILLYYLRICFANTLLLKCTFNTIKHTCFSQGMYRCIHFMEHYLDHSLSYLLFKYRDKCFIFFCKSWQVLHVTSNYRNLENKYDALTSLVSNQSQLITHLDKQCQLKNPTKAPQVRAICYVFCAFVLLLCNVDFYVVVLLVSCFPLSLVCLFPAVVI